MKMEKKGQTWPFWAILGHIVAPSRTYMKSKQWCNQGYTAEPAYGYIAYNRFVFIVE